MGTLWGWVQGKCICFLGYRLREGLGLRVTLSDSSVYGNRVSDELVYLNLGRGVVLYLCYVFTKSERKVLVL